MPMIFTYLESQIYDFVEKLSLINLWIVLIVSIIIISFSLSRMILWKI